MIIFGLGHIKGVKEERVLLVVILFLYLLVSLRSITIGNDTRNYSVIFYNMQNFLGFQKYQGRFEFGYLLLNYIVARITPCFTAFLLIENAFVYYAYYFFIKNNSSNYSLSVLLFLCLGYWGRTANTLRLEIAVACFLIAYCLFEKGKKFWGITGGIIGFFFHRISLSYWGICFVPKKINYKFYFISGLVTAGVYVFFEKFINAFVLIFPYFNNYLNGTKYVVNDVKLAIVLKWILVFFVWVFSYCIYQKKKCNLSVESQKLMESQINMVFVSLLILFLSTRFNLLDRCEELYGTFIIVLIPNIIKLFDKKRSYLLVYFLFTGLAVLYFIVVNVYRPYWNVIYPYHTFFYDIF